MKDIRTTKAYAIIVSAIVAIMSYLAIIRVITIIGDEVFRDLLRLVG